MNIQLSDTANLLNDQTATVTVSLDADGKIVVDISYGELNDYHLNHRTSVPDDFVDHMDLLAQIFAFEQVIVFKIIVSLLGKVYAIKDL